MLSRLVVLVEAASSRSKVHLATRVLVVTHLVLSRSWRTSLLRKVRSFLTLVGVVRRFLTTTTKATSIIGVISLDQCIEIAVELFRPHSLLVHVVGVWTTTISLLLIIVAALVVASAKLWSRLWQEAKSTFKARLVHHLAIASLLEWVVLHHLHLAFSEVLSVFTLTHLSAAIVSHVELIVAGVTHRRLTLALWKHLSTSHHELSRLLSLALTLAL